jgi:hypothetical protein
MYRIIFYLIIIVNQATHRVTRGHNLVPMPYPQLIGLPMGQLTLPIRVGCPWASERTHWQDCRPTCTCLAFPCRYFYFFVLVAMVSHAYVVNLFWPSISYLLCRVTFRWSRKNQQKKQSPAPLLGHRCFLCGFARRGLSRLNLLGVQANAHCCECYWTAPWAREDDNNGRGFPSHTWSTWDLVRDWAMAERPATPPIHCTNSSLQRHIDMLFQHPPLVWTVCSYSPWLPESRSICMFPSGRVEMMHAKAYRGRFPCVTNFWDFQMWHHNMMLSSNQEILFHEMILSAKSLVCYRYFNRGSMYFGLYILFSYSCPFMLDLVLTLNGKKPSGAGETIYMNISPRFWKLCCHSESLKTLLTILIYLILFIAIHYCIWHIIINLSWLFYSQTGVLSAHDVLSFFDMLKNFLQGTGDSMVNHIITESMEYSSEVTRSKKQHG